MFTQINKKLAGSLTLAVILALMVVGLALADVVLIDNDVANPGNQNTVILSATPGATVSTSAQIAINWQGTRHLKANSPINISANSSGITLPSGYTVSSVASTVPGNWNDPDTHPDFFTVNSNIEFTAPTSPGSYTYYVRWTASGYTCLTSSCLTSGGNPFIINLEVINNTPPELDLPGDITAEATSPSGAVVNFIVSATDFEDDPDPTPICTPATGSLFPIGLTTVNCVVTDSGGLSTSGSFNIRVVYQLYGFYPPVDMGDVWNVVKGGSTVPLKFEVFAGATELTDTAIVSSFVAAPVTCPATDAAVAAIEITTTGVTSLRYDLVEGQFINNWQTPKKSGTCYVVTMTTEDGSSLAANFKLK